MTKEPSMPLPPVKVEFGRDPSRSAEEIQVKVIKVRTPSGGSGGGSSGGLGTNSKSGRKRTTPLSAKDNYEGDDFSESDIQLLMDEVDSQSNNLDDEDDDFATLMNRSKNKRRILGGSGSAGNTSSGTTAPSAKYRKLVISVSDDDEDEDYDDDSNDRFVDAVDGELAGVNDDSIVSQRNHAGYIQEIADDDDDDFE
jgi:hypothetical protein